MEYKITIESITTTEYPETDYKYIDEKTGEPSDYTKSGVKKEYFKTGKMLIRTDTITVYEQRIKETDLYLKGVIEAVNK